MIGLGAQYLRAAGFGRYRITAASLGSLDLLGWLTAATRQAIMAAFGVDGKAVIRATNEYLNGIAASDHAKATALAGFINEDPMMVCSLGLEPTLTTLPKMPWRWIVGDGRAYLSTINGNINGFYCETKLIERQQSQSSFIGAHNLQSPYGRSFLYNNNNKWHLGLGEDSSISVGTISLNTEYDAVFSTIKYNSYLIVNGSTLAMATDKNTDRSTRPIMFYTDEYSVRNGKIHNCRFAYIKIGFTDQTIEYEFYPFIRNGVFGMIDVLHDVLYTNAGSGQFTEEFGYMLNGSWVTWTPPTP